MKLLKEPVAGNEEKKVAEMELEEQVKESRKVASPPQPPQIIEEKRGDSRKVKKEEKLIIVPPSEVIQEIEKVESIVNLQNSDSYRSDRLRKDSDGEEQDIEP